MAKSSNTAVAEAPVTTQAVAQTNGRGGMPAKDFLKVYLEAAKGGKTRAELAEQLKMPAASLNTKIANLKKRIEKKNPKAVFPELKRSSRAGNDIDELMSMLETRSEETDDDGNVVKK